MDSLFSKEQEKLGNIILEDNYNELDLHYRENIIIDTKKLLIFSAESGAFNIIVCLLKNYPQEYKKLNKIEKECFFKTIFKSNYYNQDMRAKLIEYCFENFKLSAELKKNIFILVLKNNHLTLYKSLKIMNVKYSKKDFLDILKFINFTKPENHELLFSHLLQIFTKNYHLLLPLINYVESYNEMYSFTIAFYEKLSKENKQLWINYLFKSNNLYFHAHQTHQEMLKLNGYNELDLNVDFIYFITHYVIHDFSTIEEKKLNKLNGLVNKLKNDKAFAHFLIPLIKNIESLLLKNNFEKILNNKQKEGQRNKI